MAKKQQSWIPAALQKAIELMDFRSPTAKKHLMIPRHGCFLKQPSCALIHHHAFAGDARLAQAKD